MGGQEKNYSKEQGEAPERRVYEFGTVEDFWCMIHNTHSPSQLGSLWNYSLFRQQVSPAWEDPAFKRGGRWVLNLEKAKTETLDELWVCLCMALSVSHSRTMAATLCVVLLLPCESVEAKPHFGCQSRPGLNESWP